MNNLKKVLCDNNIKLKGLKKLNRVIILDTNKGKYVYKENTNNYDIYEYLKTRGFNYFPRCISSNSKGELVEYIDSFDIPREQKVSDLIHLSGILHRTTSFTREIDLDELKEMYESIVKNIDYLRSYYEDLNNYIDTKVFMSPSEYLLVSNMDVIYYLLYFSKEKINIWYDLLKNKKSIKYSLIHNNLDTSHLIENNNKYLISWDKSKQDMPINDIIKLYQDNYYDLDLEKFLREYEKEYKIDEDEYLLFLIKLANLKKIEFTRNTYKDCYNINNYLVYLRKIVVLVQKYKKNLNKV